MCRVAEEMLLSCGSRIGYFQGDVKLLVEDIEALKPTIFVGVPRVFDRIHSGILAKVDAAGGIKKRLFQWALARKQHFIQRGFPVNKVRSASAGGTACFTSDVVCKACMKWIGFLVFQPEPACLMAMTVER